MWDMIVLGNIPGTSINVTFVTWLYIVGALAWASILLWCLSKRVLFASWKIARILGKEVTNAQSEKALKSMSAVYSS